MGMYTELVLAVELKEDTPSYVFHTLEVMLDLYGITDIFRPVHPLFQTSRWKWMLQSGSAYFPGIPHSELRRDYYFSPHLTVRCNLKNYESEIELFLDWLEPFISSQGFVGYKQYEEDEVPTLLFFENGWVTRGVA